MLKTYKKKKGKQVHYIAHKDFELHWLISGLGQYPVEIVKYSFKSPNFYVLNNEVFSLRKCMIPKCFTRMTSSMVEIPIEPKSKLPTARQTTY